MVDLRRGLHQPPAPAQTDYHRQRSQPRLRISSRHPRRICRLGAFRILAAAPGSGAYPGFSARQMVTGSYKNDAAAKQTPARRQARKSMVALLTTGDNPFGLTLAGSTQLLDSLVGDASGDRLDAVLCAMQAAWAWQRRDDNYGLPMRVDPLEGWIVTVPSNPVRP